jgi:glycosyltransferase involved in cell wall biosynthesis
MRNATLLREGVAGTGRPDPVLSSSLPPRKQKPHVCFVAPYAWPVLSRDPDIKVVGGAEVQQAILARLLARAGYRVSMICCDYGQPSPVEVDGVTVHKTFRPDAGLPVLRFLHPRLSTMWKALREVDADVYYQRSSAVWTGIVAAFCRHHGKGSIYAGASDRDFVRGAEQIKYRRDRWIYRRGLATVDAIVAQNKAQVQTCREHHGREAVLIQSCYELPGNSSSEEKNLVLWVGTIHDQKRPELLLEMAKRLPQRRFVMVGGPSPKGERFQAGYYESIQAQAAGLPNVEFTGFLPLARVEPWFDRARVLVCTSEFEGMPNVFLQAWARGVPVVSSVDVGVPMNRLYREVDEAVRHIEALFADDGEWRAASQQALAYFGATHSPEQILKQYAQLIEKVSR